MPVTHWNARAPDEFYRRDGATHMGLEAGLPLPVVWVTGIILFVVLALYAVANADEA